MLKINPSSKHHPAHARRRALEVPFGTGRLLAMFEGIEGGFAIGSSIVVALSVAGLQKDLLLLTAVISIVVSGFNSASVKYSSEHYLDELDGHEKRSPLRHYFIPAFLEFICYVILSLLAVLPLIIIDHIPSAVGLSVALTLIMLFLAGAWRGYILRMNSFRDGFETVLLGAGIIVIGFISGLVVNSL